MATVARHATGTVAELVGSPHTGPLFSWYDFGAASGVLQPSGLQRNILPGLAVEVGNDPVPVCRVTPAGIFDGCVRARYAYPGGAAPDGAILTEDFAPGIGLVEREIQATGGNIVYRLSNVRAAGFSLLGRRPLQASLRVDPDTIYVGGARPPNGNPPPPPDVRATLSLSAPQGPVWVWQGAIAATFYAIDESGERLAKIAAPRLPGSRWIRIGAQPVEVQVVFPGSTFQIGKNMVAAESNLVFGGAAPASTIVTVVPAP